MEESAGNGEREKAEDEVLDHCTIFDHLGRTGCLDIPLISQNFSQEYRVR